MAAFELALAGETASVLGDPVLVIGSLAVTGVLGVTDLFGGDGDEDTTDDSADDGGMFDESEFDGGGGGGDEFAFDDGGGGGEFDDLDMDGADGDDGASAVGVTELEGRVDQVEEELSSLSSTVSTVRTENEQIGESVEDIEENVRKLLDIYKMVTKGVNPFVDQKGGESMASPGGSSLGLFDDEEEEAGSAEASNLDEDVVEAEAEEFFDDDFDDDEEFEDQDELEAEDATDDTAEEETDDGSEGGGRSFDELREEYEEGGGWDEEDEDAEDDAGDAEAADDEAEDEELEDDADAQEVDADDEATDDEGMDDEATDADDRVDDLLEEPEPERTDEPVTERETRTVHETPEEPEPDSRSVEQERTATASTAEPDREKPYLREIPPGYSNDLLAMEWVEFLVAEGGETAARHAIAYYERVDWIDAAAGDRLREYLDGHPSVGDVGDAVALTMDHHAKSLQYVARLNGDEFTTVSVSHQRERTGPQDRRRPGTVARSPASR